MSVQRSGEWTFTVYKRPAGLKLERAGEPALTMSEKELKDLWDGKTDFRRYRKIPRHLYKKVFWKVCEALERAWMDHVFERAVPPSERRVVSDLTRREWDVALSKTKEMKKRIDALRDFAEGLEEVMEIVKKVKKK